MPKIEGRLVKMRTVRANVGGRRRGNKIVGGRTELQEHLFMDEHAPDGEDGWSFGKHNHGLWLVRIPNEDPFLIAPGSGWAVTEHPPGTVPDHPDDKDGVISVSGPAFEHVLVELVPNGDGTARREVVTKQWRLEKGYFVQVLAEEQTSVPLPATVPHPPVTAAAMPMAATPAGDPPLAEPPKT